MLTDTTLQLDDGDDGDESGNYSPRAIHLMTTFPSKKIRLSHIPANLSADQIAKWMHYRLPVEGHEACAST